jgi:hypothetical protein
MVARVHKASCTSTLIFDLKTDACGPVVEVVFFNTRATIEREAAMTTRIAVNHGSSQRCVHCFVTKATKTVRIVMNNRAKKPKMTAAIAIPLQNGKSIVAVEMSTIMSDVEAVSNANVTKLARQMMGRAEEVRKPRGAIVTTDDHRVVEGFQKVVLRDKEVELVVAGLAG